MVNKLFFLKRTIFILFISISFHGLSQTYTLSPNECFFSPKGTLKLYGLTTVTDPYNNNKHYDRIGNWQNIQDTIVWGLKNVQPGTLSIELFAAIATTEDKSIVSVFLDDQYKELQVSSTLDMQDFQSQGTVDFTVSEEGTHEVKIKIKSRNSTSDFGEIEKLIVTGSALNGAEVWKRRWRPAAIHASFLSDNDNNTEITVYEITILTSQFWSYQVMTTEFGYIGSPIQNSLFSGLNFSLWSYGASDPVPPHDELSHLIAVSGPGNYFGRYGHEGTGVKPRGFNPYNGITTTTYTIAARKMPGKKYNTFWNYYLDPQTQHWKLYGCGKKLNKDGSENYMKTTGGFVEIVGAPDVGRTGHRQRVVEYRGWRMQTDKTWNIIDRIDPAYNSDAEISYKEWAQNSTGNRFVFKPGGLLDSKPDPGIIQLSSPSPVPDYLQGEYISELYKMPAEFNVQHPEYVNDSTIIVKYHIKELGTNPNIKIYYGKKYGLTEGIFEDKQIDPYWENSLEVSTSSIQQDTLKIKLENLTKTDYYYYRLRVQNDEGIMWAFDTDTFSLDILSAINLPELTGKQISIFPNPVKDKLRIEVSDNIRIKNISVINSAGYTVLKDTLAYNAIDLKGLPTGIYNIVIDVEGYKRYSKKILKK